MKRTAKERSTDLQHARSLAVKCAEERDAANRTIETNRVNHQSRIEALHDDLRVRTAERDAALRAVAQGRAELAKFAADLQAEVASLKDERGQLIGIVQEWKAAAMNAMLDVGNARAHAEILARLIVENKQGAHELAGIILAESKPCAP